MKFVINFVKASKYQIIVLILGIFIMNIIVYLNEWNVGDNKKIPSFCYVLIKEKKINIIVPFNELIHKKQVAYVKEISLNNKEKHSSSWQLTNINGVINLSWYGGITISTFKYKIINSEIHPLSCQYKNIGMLFSGLLYSFLIILVIRTILWIFHKYSRKTKFWTPLINLTNLKQKFKINQKKRKPK